MFAIDYEDLGTPASTDTKQVTLEAAMGASSLKEELDQMIARGAGIVQGAGLGPRPGMPQRPVMTGGGVKR